MASSARVVLMFTLCPAIVALGSQSSAPTFLTFSRQAQTARDAHQLEKAVLLYQQALKLKPNWEEGLWNLGSITYDLDRYNDCATAFSKLAAVKPDGAPGWTMSGLCEYKLHNYARALESLAHVEQLSFGENAELAHAARLHYALLLTKTENYEKAITILTDVARTGKTPELIAAAGIAGLRRPWLPAETPEADRELVYRMGEAMTAAMVADYATANQKFEELLKTYPSEPNVHFRFGALLYIQDADRGIEEIKKAIALDPGHVPALVSLSVISLKREDAKAALEYGERAVKAGPNDFSPHVVLGRALLALEQPERAASELEQAVSLNPAAPEAHFSLATAYSRLGRKTDSAREQAEFKKLEHLGGN